MNASEAVAGAACETPGDRTKLFRHEGDTVTFGSSKACDITIPDPSKELSATAGRVWRLNGHLWVENMSTAHSLFLRARGRPSESPLPPAQQGQPPPARAIPGNDCYLWAPGGLWMTARQRDMSGRWVAGAPDAGSTVVGLAPVLELLEKSPKLAETARVLCAPLFEGDPTPTFARALGAELGITYGAARDRIEELVREVEERVPELVKHFTKERESGLALLGDWFRPPGSQIQRYRPPAEVPKEQRAAEISGGRKSVEVAHWLVRSGAVRPRPRRADGLQHP